MIDLDAYWLAGLLEGEGSFMVGSADRPNQPRVGLVTADADVMARAARLIGVSYQLRKDKLQPNWSPVYSLRARGTRSVNLMRVIYPVMGARRQLQIDRALASWVPPVRVFSDDERVEIVRRYLAGERVMDLARSYGVAHQLISRLIRKQSGALAHVGRAAPSQGAGAGFETLRLHQPDTSLDAPPALHWLAGLLEGEGSFMKGLPSDPGRPVVQVQMTDEDVIARVACLIGRKPYAHRTSGRPEAWKPVFSARTTGRPAVELMTRLRPLMGERRQGQIDLALASAFTKPHGKQKVAAAQVDEIVRRFRSGESAEALALEYGISKWSVWSYHEGRRSRRV
jgi:transposase-like protein